MRTAWDALEDQLKTLHNYNTTPQLVPDTYTLLFPASLSGPLTVNPFFTIVHFYVHSPFRAIVIFPYVILNS